MNLNLTEIAVVLDRSGSMVTIKDDMIGGFRTFIAEQRALPDPCLVSMYQFDDLYEMVYEEVPVAEVGELELAPRGSTALYDAVGRTIANVAERHLKKSETDRPGKVVIMVITDGKNNSSREITQAQLKSMIQLKEGIGWQFAFLAANVDAPNEAAAIGINVRSVKGFEANEAGVQSMYSSASAGIGAYRSSKHVGAMLKIPKKDKDSTTGEK